MSLLNRFKLGISMLVNCIWNWMWGKLDNKFKRMCLLASLHAALTNNKDIEENSIRALNTKMRLVRDEKALRLPILMGPIIWKSIKNVDKFDLGSERYAERIARKTPCWLRYTDDTTFIMDIKKLLSYNSNERMTPA